MEPQKPPDMRSIFDVEANAADGEEAARHFARGAEAGRRLVEELRGLNPYPIMVDALVADVIASSAIEGERLDPRQVRAAVVKRLAESEASRALNEHHSANSPHSEPKDGDLPLA